MKKESISPINTKVYAGRVKHRETLLRSSSGGAFSVLSDNFLENNGAIVASIYNYQSHSLDYQFIQDKVERDKACGSKYIQSRPGNVFRAIEKWLMNNPDKPLLFVGMGCQAEGFRKYIELKGLRDRVFIVDIICHGSPSPKIWHEYVKNIEQKYSGKVTYLTFKDKRNGWKSPTAYVLINAHEVSIKDYVRLFYNHVDMRPSCHICPFATIERKTDITIGDFWHIEDRIPDFFDSDGTSLFLIHTKQGEDLFNLISNNLDYRLSDKEQCWQINLEKPTAASRYRKKFWKDYHRFGIEYVMNKYGKLLLKSKIKKLLTLVRARGGGFAK